MLIMDNGLILGLYMKFSFIANTKNNTYLNNLLFVQKT